MADWYVYILACRDRTLYTGSVTDPLPIRLVPEPGAAGEPGQSA